MNRILRDMFWSRLTISGLLALSFPIATMARDQTTAVWSDGHASVLSDEELIRYALTAPPVPYPDEARKTNATGSGLYELRIDKAGTTTGVKIVKSSGSAVLDKTATTAFKKWRFKPASFRSVQVPVSWSVNRVP